MNDRAAAPSGVMANKRGKVRYLLLRLRHLERRMPAFVKHGPPSRAQSPCEILGSSLQDGTVFHSGTEDVDLIFGRLEHTVLDSTLYLYDRGTYASRPKTPSKCAMQA